MIEVYSSQVCPFAQRVRATLTHLDVPHRLHEIDLDDREPEFLAKTPTGKVPLLVDGRVVLYESEIICEYLAEQHRWPDAFDEHPGLRARQRLAMKMWDETVAPAFYAGLQEGQLDHARRQGLAGELKELAKTVHATGAPTGDLLSFHVAPFWVRMDWLRELSPVHEIVGEWVDVKRWLDATVEQPAIQVTSPDREVTIARYRAEFTGARGD